MFIQNSLFENKLFVLIVHMKYTSFQNEEMFN